MRLQVVSPGFHVPGGAFVDAPHLLTQEEEQAIRNAPNADLLLARTMRVSDEAAGNIEHAGPAVKLPAHDGGDHGHDVAAQPPQAAAAHDPAPPPAKGATGGTPAGPSASLESRGSAGGSAKSL